MGQLGEPFTALADAVDRFTASLHDNDSPWLVAPVRERLDEVSDELDVEGRRVANLAAATRQLPELFGAEGERRYFVAFITPSEARALGGHMANYAELTIADGRMSLSRFGRAADLIEANADRSTRILSGPDAYLDRYGVFGAGGDGVPTVPLWWLSVTISPDFPSVAEVISELYENGTGREVDGVLAIDPTGLAGLLRVTGPVDVPSLGRQLTADNVVDFLQREQYLLFGAGENEERADLLGEVARTTFDSFASSGDTDPVDLVQNLAPAVSAGHFLAWSADFGEQQLFTAIGASGSFARQGLRDGLAVTNLNVSANKIDAFLTRTVSYHAVVDEESGAVTGTVDVTLTNDAPTDGLPAYVIGNSVGLPPGYNQTYLTLYTAGDVTGTTVDGAAAEPALGSELGWTYAEQRLIVPPGSSMTASYEVVGAVDPSAPVRVAGPRPADGGAGRAHRVGHHDLGPSVGVLRRSARAHDRLPLRIVIGSRRLIAGRVGRVERDALPGLERFVRFDHNCDVRLWHGCCRERAQRPPQRVDRPCSQRHRGRHHRPGTPVARIVGLDSTPVLERLTAQGIVGRPAESVRPVAGERRRPTPERPVADIVSEQRQ